MLARKFVTKGSIYVKRTFWASPGFFSSKMDLGTFDSLTTRREEVEETVDVSIEGLPMNMVKRAFTETLKRGAAKDTQEMPLGRWKTGVDNHEKGYSYDHSA